MSISRIDLLDIVCNPTDSIAVPHRLAILTCRNPHTISVCTSAACCTIENAIIWRPQIKDESHNVKNFVLAALPDVDCPTEAIIETGKNKPVKINTAPVKPFSVFIMPTSHLCFGYLTGLPEHIEAGRVVADAVDLIESTSDYHFSVEFMRGLVNFAQKYPEKLPAARKAFKKGRLGVSAIWTPSNFEIYDGEAHIRHLAESQWWFRENFGATAPTAMGCDSAGFDPQQPQIFQKAGLKFFWRCRYTLWEKDSGSPFINHTGVDGTLLPCFVSRRPISSGYIWPPVSEMWQAGQKADRDDIRFGEMVRELDDYLHASKKICNADFNVHFAGGDQSQTDPGQIQRLNAWNRIFHTPSLYFSSIGPMTEKLTASTSFARDNQAGEQPHWGPICVAGCRLTLYFQEASYALSNAEKMAVLDMFINSTPYPEAELKAAWLNVLNEQHHEQLGHAAHDAVEHSRDLLRRAVFLARDIMTCSAERIASRINFQDSGTPVTVFNTLNWKRCSIVELFQKDAKRIAGTACEANMDKLCVIDREGHPVPYEISPAGSLKFMAEVDSFGYNTYYLKQSGPDMPAAASDLKTGTNFIENKYYRLEVNPETGCVINLLDKVLNRTLLKEGGNRMPFEYVVHEDNGRGWCLFWPTGKLWRSSKIPDARIKISSSMLSAKLIIERGLLEDEGEACVGKTIRTEFELPTETKRLDVKISIDWNSPVPKRELRLFLPLALEKPDISYDTLFATSDYDEDMPQKQRLYAHWDTWSPDSDNKEAEMLYDWRHVTRFISAYEKEWDMAVTLSPPQGLLRVEEGGVSFTLIEDRTDCYVDMFPDMKGHHIFYMSLTSHRGDWKKARSWRFGWEQRGRFNPLITVVPEALYPILDEHGKLIEVDGNSLVVSAIKKSEKGEDMIVRVYDAAGDGDNFGFRLSAPYLGHQPFVIGQFRHKAIPGLPEQVLKPLSLLRSDEVNLLEDSEREIDPVDIHNGKFRIADHSIFTARLSYEKPRRSWVPTYEIRQGGALDEKETPY